MKKLTAIVGSFAAVAIFALGSGTTYAATATEITNASTAALAYLQTNQQVDGSITNASGFNVNDWAAIGVTASGVSASDFALTDGTSLADYVASEVVSDVSPFTTIERKILALSALGLDTSAEEQLLLEGFDGTQIGDDAAINDDIFGILAIAASGNPDLWEAAQASTQFIIDNQQADGSFCWNVACDWGSDNTTTASAIAALTVSKDLDLGIDIDTALNSAVANLLSAQITDGVNAGGFGYDGWSEADGSSTAWAIMALNTVGDYETERDAAIDWLTKINQATNSDGGFMYGPWGMTSSDTSTTSEVLIAINGASWVLNPQSMTAPVPEIVEDTEEPVVAPTAAESQTPTTPEVVATPAVTTAAPVVYEAAPEVTQAAQSEITQGSEADDTAVLAATTKTTDEKTASSTIRTIGWSLFALAIIGFAGYLFYILRRA